MYRDMDTLLLFLSSVQQEDTEIAYRWQDDGITHEIVLTHDDGIFYVWVRKTKDGATNEEAIFDSAYFEKAASIFVKNATTRMLG